MVEGSTLIAVSRIFTVQSQSCNDYGQAYEAATEKGDFYDPLTNMSSKSRADNGLRVI